MVCFNPPSPFTAPFPPPTTLIILIYANENLRIESNVNAWVNVRESQTCQSLRVSVNSAERKASSAETISRARARKT